MSSLSFPISGTEMLRNLGSTHDLVRMTPSGHEHLAYSLVLPKGWVTEDLGEQKDGIGQLVQIGLFADHAGPSASIVQVFYSRMPIEIGLRDWLEYKAAEFGTRLVYLQNVRFACGPGVDAGGVYGPEDNQQVVRLVVHADGGRIFLVSTMTPRYRYDAERNDVAIATNSFKLLRPSGSPQLEQWLDSSGGDPGFHVAYPASWTSRAVEKHIPGKSGVDLLLTVEQELAGYLRVKATDPARAEVPEGNAALKIASEEIAEGGLLLTSQWIEDRDPGLERLEDFASAYMVRARLGEQLVDVRFSQLRREGLVFALTALSVERSKNPILWMRVRRAYEIALGTARPD